MPGTLWCGAYVVLTTGGSPSHAEEVSLAIVSQSTPDVIRGTPLNYRKNFLAGCINARYLNWLTSPVEGISRDKQTTGSQKWADLPIIDMTVEAH